MLKVIVLVVHICMNNVDPRYNAYSCISEVLQCHGVQFRNIDDCLDYWISNKKSSLDYIDRSF